jgi:crotonobetainyl-CoA:carnitine CoA-transferase CaiB-like acyl-CoA transferase
MPLDGVRVLDWTIWQQGPVCSLMLGELGAEVIKIEERTGGDPGRGLTKLSGVDLSGMPNFYFEATNRNKKSLTLDLKQPEGKAIVYELVAKSDVFVQNFRQGVAERLGLDYAALRRHNPRLIYASGSGYGPEGPDRAAPSFDRLGLARSGIMYCAGDPDMPPLPIVEGIADQMGAVLLSYGVLAALLARDRFGVGQQVDASLLGSMMWLQNLSVSARLMMGFAIPRVPRAYAANPLWSHYRCADGRWLALGMLQADRYWASFCAALGRPELGTDPRFENLRVRAGNAGDCVAILDEIFATKPRDEWLRVLRAAGDFIVTPVNSVDDLPDDPQVRANGYITEIEHPQFGRTEVLPLPVRLRETPTQVRRTAPEFGQHTEEILTELLGYSWERVAELKEREVI